MAGYDRLNHIGTLKPGSITGHINKQVLCQHCRHFTLSYHMKIFGLLAPIVYAERFKRGHDLSVQDVLKCRALARCRCIAERLEATSSAASIAVDTNQEVGACFVRQVCALLKL
ncbi:hypothetical protein D3C77_580070 [compost metagenome]